MATISFTRDITLTNEEAQIILNSKPSQKLQDIIENLDKTKSELPVDNKLIAKYL